jgi:hypothetical protein
MATATRSGVVVEPAAGAVATYHNAKYDVFKRLYADQIAYREIMNGRSIGATAQ